MLVTHHQMDIKDAELVQATHSQFSSVYVVIAKRDSLIMQVEGIVKNNMLRVIYIK